MRQVALYTFISVALTLVHNKENMNEIMNQVYEIASNGFKINGQHDEVEDFDFIIVGAGSAGCVIANRLSEIAEWKILLLETGGPETDFSKTPMLAPFLQFTPFNWGFKTEPQTTACRASDEQKCVWPKGKALGGTSAINLMLYFRGTPYDFDSWAAQGNLGWSYEEVLPYFRKSERVNFEGADLKYHGQDGYLQVTTLKKSNIVTTFIDGGIEMGFKKIDPNTREVIGFSEIYATLKNKKRHSAAAAFLEPALKRKNLKVLTHARVTKILIDPTTTQAYGVQYVRNDQKVVVTARKEVIVTAGVLNTPQLLMLSGIGPKEHLIDVGITPIVDAQVGQTIYDQIMYYGLMLEINQTETINLLPTGDDDPVLPLVSGIGLIPTEFSDQENYPDVELHLLPITFASKLGEAGRRFIGLNETFYNLMYKSLENKMTMAIFPKLLHPKSVGHMKLRSNDPFDYPVIYPEYFTDPENIDKKTLIAGIRFVNRLIQTQAFQRLNAKVYDKPFVTCEDYDYDSDDYWSCAIEYMTVSGFHQCGTSKMGPEDDPDAVVNHDLEVYGIKGLRVADGSVIPKPIAAHLNAPTIMIGEKAADLIKQKWGKLHVNSIEEECENIIK